LVGWGDPIGLLRLDGDDFLVAAAIIDKATQLKADANRHAPRR
jgi:hypothetical protein